MSQQSTMKINNELELSPFYSERECLSCGTTKKVKNFLCSCCTKEYKLIEKETDRILKAELKAQKVLDKSVKYKPIVKPVKIVNKKTDVNKVLTDRVWLLHLEHFELWLEDDDDELFLPAGRDDEDAEIPERPLYPVLQKMTDIYQKNKVNKKSMYVYFDTMKEMCEQHWHMFGGCQDFDDVNSFWGEYYDIEWNGNEDWEGGYNALKVFTPLK